MTNIAIIGSGPTGIYTLRGLIESDVALTVTVYEANADPGKETPYHPSANDRAMLANIASIGLPPVCERLAQWLRRKSPAELAMLGIAVENIGEREFYPRVVLGEYFQAQLEGLLAKAVVGGHVVNVKASHRVVDIQLRERDIDVEVASADGTIVALRDLVHAWDGSAGRRASNDQDLRGFRKYFKMLFVDDYATVPHQSIERLLALHRVGRLSVPNSDRNTISIPRT